MTETTHAKPEREWEKPMPNDANLLNARCDAKAVFFERLHDPRAKPILLDGALGTELERRGLHCALPLWSAHALLEAPEVVREIHREYLRAGAELLTANTFRTQRRTLRHSDLEARSRELAVLAIRLAREAIREHCTSKKLSREEEAAKPTAYLVLGSNPPLEDCFRPDLVPNERTLAREHEENIASLLEAGVDLVLIETMNCIREAVAAAKAAHSLGATNLVSFCATTSGTLLSGETLADAIEAVAPHAPSAVLANCLHPAAIRACLPALASAGLPFGVYANNIAIQNSPDAQLAASAELAPDEYAIEAKRWLKAGARIIGGCCGTTPAHIAKLAETLA